MESNIDSTAAFLSRVFCCDKTLYINDRKDNGIKTKLEVELREAEGGLLLL